MNESIIGDAAARLQCLALASQMPGDDGRPDTKETLRAAQLFYNWLTNGVPLEQGQAKK